MNVRNLNIAVIALVVTSLFSCSKDPQDTGLEFAPNMYVSEPLDPLTQKVGAKYPYNSNDMTMREPVAGTIARGKMPYNVEKDDLEGAALVKSPIATTPESLQEGAALYDRFCEHCHGVTGDGKGLVGDKYKGVPKYTSNAIKDKSEGHIFHVITHGKGRMKAHASQLSQEERWLIVQHVQTLQKK